MKRIQILILILAGLTAASGTKAQNIRLTIDNVPDVWVFLDGQYKGYCPFPGELVIENIDTGWHKVSLYGLGGAMVEKELVLFDDYTYYLTPVHYDYEALPLPPDQPPLELQNVYESGTIDLQTLTAMGTWHIELLNEEKEEVSDYFFIVEDMPLFDGGPSDGFRNYISENLQYPQIPAENGIQGRVYVQFTVDRTGKVTDAVVVRGVDPELDMEALRVVRSSPRWTPGKQRGIPVNVRFTFPIVFVLQ